MEFAMTVMKIIKCLGIGYNEEDLWKNIYA